MGTPEGGIPDLQLRKPDGTIYPRIEMEQQMRDLWKRVYWLRRKASIEYGLSNITSHDMKEAVLRHWVLDEMIRRGQITGNQIGVSATNYNEENEHRQFVQRLAALIQAGEAIMPKDGEGVDMSNLPQQPPPPVIQNGQNGYAQQPQFTPPAPPMMTPPVAPPNMAAPPGYAPPQPPSFASPQGVAPPPGMVPPPQGFVPQPMSQPLPQPPMPQQQNFAPNGFAPGMIPQQAAPSMAPPMAPQMAPQMAPPQGNPPNFAPPGVGVPQQAMPPQLIGGRGRKKQDAAPVPPIMQATPVPPMGMAPGMIPAAPQGFAPQAAPFQQAPAPVPSQAPGVDLSPLVAKIDSLTTLVANQEQMLQELYRQIEMITKASSLSLFVLYQKSGVVNLENTLREIIPS